MRILTTARPVDRRIRRAVACTREISVWLEHRDLRSGQRSRCTRDNDSSVRTMDCDSCNGDKGGLHLSTGRGLSGAGRKGGKRELTCT